MFSYKLKELRDMFLHDVLRFQDNQPLSELTSYHCF